MNMMIQSVQNSVENFDKIQSTIYTAELIGDTVKGIIMKMPRPEEVLIDVDDNGMPKIENIQGTENAVLYEVVKETLCNICDLDWEATRLYIMFKLEKQMESEFSEQSLSKLCWAIGTISGKLPHIDEKNLLITIIRTLLYLCEGKSGKNNKSIVASNIMYIVGQFPRFLKTNWNFTLVVVNKLYEFMNEPFQGVMDMACKTFLGIAISLKGEFIINQTR